MKRIPRPILVLPSEPAPINALSLDEAVQITLATGTARRSGGEYLATEAPVAARVDRTLLAFRLAGEWNCICVHIAERIAFLAKHAGRRCPV
ncbi:MAG: hypothetical protein WDN25_03875 [Acetobacteraceae bacterium]